MAAEILIDTNVLVYAYDRTTEASERLQNLLQTWPCLEISGLILLEAARAVRDHRLSFWDGLIWATARLHQIPNVFSEDLVYLQNRPV